MKLTEKMSYLQGLIDGLEIDASTKEGKALIQMSAASFMPTSPMVEKWLSKLPRYRLV